MINYQQNILKKVNKKLENTSKQIKFVK